MCLYLGVLTIGNSEYQINQEFTQETLELSDALDLDELVAADLLSKGQQESSSLDRSALASSVITFHRSREYLLDCLRISFQLGNDTSQDEESRAPLRTFVYLVLDRKISISSEGAGSQYWQQLLKALSGIEKWLIRISERMQSAAMLGQTHATEFAEIMQFQHQSLLRQHESLGAIGFCLVKGNYTTHEDGRALLQVLKKLDRFDTVALHYLPMATCTLSLFAGSESRCPLPEARELHDSIASTKDTDVWPLRSFGAAMTAVWLAEYSGRYLDASSDPRLTGVDLEAEADARSARFMESLRDGALHFILYICQDIKSHERFDAPRYGLTAFLLQDSLSLQLDGAMPGKYFQEIVMEQFQTFVDAFITNMPDTLRKLKFDEDEQRRQMHTAVQARPVEHALHLERFLVLISFAFEGFPHAAEAFWADTDGNLYGFLQWASQRQSTPRVAAFCEMLRALSDGGECADAAHKFLVEEGSGSVARFRRTGSLSWLHITCELEFYATAIRDKSLNPQGLGPTPESLQPDLLVEPESAMMIECFLRLAAHLLRESDAARDWILTQPTFHLHDYLIILCRSSIEARLRACAFATLTALLTRKTRETNDGMWAALDTWIAGPPSQPPANTRLANLPAIALSSEQPIFDAIGTGFEEPMSFLGLLQALVEPSVDDETLDDGLPFPEALGSAYRMPGLEPYIDFVLGRVFAEKSNELPEIVHVRMIRSACLAFAATCLASFNENLIVFANRSTIPVDSAMRTSTLANYARLHPFARVMEWFFNDKVISALFATLEQDVQEVNAADVESPLVQGLLRSIEVISLVVELQATYLDIVRPIVKLQSTSRRPGVANSALASFEDAVLNNIQIVARLGLYSGSGFEHLSIASLKLLQKLSSSRKLAPPTLGLKDCLPEKSRLITVFEYNNDAESVARSLIQEIQFEPREVEFGPQSVGLEIKSQILRFLNMTLEACNDRPSLPHLLLGFTCTAQSLEVSEGTIFARNQALFHAVMRFRLDCPLAVSDSVLSWLCILKDAALQALRLLWKSPLSSPLTIAEMRANDYVFAEFLQQLPINSAVAWDGKLMDNPQFFLSESVSGYVAFLRSRAGFLELVATELQSAANSRSTLLCERIKSSLLGITKLPDGEQLHNMTIFDHLDFLELNHGTQLPLPETQWFDTNDFGMCRIEQGSAMSKYNLAQAEQILALQTNALRSSERIANINDEQQVLADAHNLLHCLTANNGHLEVSVAHAETLKAWIQLIIVAMTCCHFDADERQNFVLQTLQLVLPRLEEVLSVDASISLLLIQLGRFLLCHVDASAILAGSTSGDVAVDRLFHVYRVSLDALHSQASNLSREFCYQICHKYLQSISSVPAQSLGRRKALQTFKAAGDYLVEIICDDAYAGERQCRTAAMLFLGALVAISNEEKSRHIIDAFARLNFVYIIVDAIRTFPFELQEANTACKLSQRRLKSEPRLIGMQHNYFPITVQAYHFC